MSRRLKKDRVYTTDSIYEAFDAALAWANWSGRQTWESGEGPAAVRDVQQVKGGWRITYRLVKHWGKEAW